MLPPARKSPDGSRKTTYNRPGGEKESMSALFLKKLSRRSAEGEEYPLSAAVIRKLKELEFRAPVTIFCGDNGCGKSTLLEILAACLRMNRIGRPMEADEKRKAIAGSVSAFRLTYLHPKKNFFFSAEDFIKYIDWVENTKRKARDAIAEVDGYLTGYAAALAKSPHYRTLGELEELYANSLAVQSHGEGFLDFFRSRIAPDGLYLLDEPEGALSYENQYLLSRIVMEAVRENCQFVIATHSPVVTAIPDAEIFEIRGGELCACAYEEVANNEFLRMFLSHRKSMMRE